MDVQLDSIEDAIEAIKRGEVIIVVDDEGRENEGDFICAADTITPEIINFMAIHGRGLICASLLEERCRELDLNLMVESNTSNYYTPFTISVDLVGHGCTTGISASDRAKTVKALVDPATTPEDLGRPGHIFPLRARQGGVLRRPGHTEATVDFARLAGLTPAGVLVEIMNEDGSMARLPDLKKVADKFKLKLVSIKDLIEYRLKHETLIQKELEMTLPSHWGNFELIAYKHTNSNDVHIALKKGTWSEDEPVLVRVHSSNIPMDVFWANTQSSDSILHRAMEIIEEEGKGVILYMNQMNRTSGILEELKAYKYLQEGVSVAEANRKAGVQFDEKDYGIGAQILRDLGISQLKLISNNPKRRKGIEGYGLEIVGNVPLNK